MVGTTPFSNSPLLTSIKLQNYAEMPHAYVANFFWGDFPGTFKVQQTVHNGWEVEGLVPAELFLYITV